MRKEYSGFLQFQGPAWVLFEGKHQEDLTIAKHETSDLRMRVTDICFVGCSVGPLEHLEPVYCCLLICFQFGGKGSSTDNYSVPISFWPAFKGFTYISYGKQIFLNSLKKIIKPLYHMRRGKIFSFPLSLKKEKKTPNIIMNNERKTNGAIPFHGGGAE